MQNPLLERAELPPFAKIQPEHIQPAIEQIIHENETFVDQLLQNTTHFSWDTLQLPLDTIDDRLNQAWSPVGHMNAVVNNEALRNAYNACLPLLSEHSTKIGQNVALYEAYQQLFESPDFQSYNSTQQKVVTDQLRDFKLAGVALPEEQKAEFKELKKKLSELTSQFSDNVLDATMGWSKLITDPSELAGLPESAMAASRQLAQAKNYDEGWLLNLDFPSYFPVVTYCDNSRIREEVYTAFCTRASDQGPQAGKHDNSNHINEILSLRHQLANLLGFTNYAEYSLATKMADSTENVINFLEDLAKRSKPQAEKELAELKAYVKSEFNVDQLEAWDITYYSEKLRQSRYAISQEELRRWFPVEKVITGLFEITNRLFGVHIKLSNTVETWHPDVQFYDVYRNKKVIGRFYLDLFAREHKRSGAWMDQCRIRYKKGNDLQLPVAYLTCNFTPPVGDKPALLTHDEVVTLFHEFGHGLHHMLTQVNYYAVSGINGVPWDAVELPSQFMENWCWEKEGLALMSGDFETGEPLPADKLVKLLAARNFQSAMMMLRQLEFSLFDFKLHKEYHPSIDVQDVVNNVRKEVSVITPPPFNRFQNSFSHIFAGGYAAGYYSYKWAEVLSADAFSKFEEEGIFNKNTGHLFLQEILEKGGSAEPMTLFINFRGREPSIDALLRHSGIS